jgi:hypothetical protein
MDDDLIGKIKTTITAVVSFATGAVLFGPVGATVIGGAVWG